MIYTITVNPALDVTLVCEEPVMPTTVRPKEEWRHAGGKGIDVSRVVRNLGEANVAMGFLGGFTGRYIEGCLLEDGLEIDFVYISQETRTNVIIIAPDPSNPNEKLAYRYNAPGPEVQPVEYLELYNRIRALATAPSGREPTYAAICGSLSGKKINVLSYVSIISEFKRMGAVTALDTSGAPMKESIRYAPRPDIIKPNIAEFNELIDDGLILSDDLRNKARPAKEQYLREMCKSSCGVGSQEPASGFWNLLLQQACTFCNKYPDVTATMISLGAPGILLARREGIHHGFLQCSVSVVSPVGAGDAALAAFIFARDKGEDWESALKLAVAAGAAAVTMPGTEAPPKDQVMKYLNQVEVHKHTA